MFTAVRLLALIYIIIYGNVWPQDSPSCFIDLVSVYFVELKNRFPGLLFKNAIQNPLKMDLGKKERGCLT